MEVKDIEEFRSLIIELHLPGQVDVLFGVRCPVCGKTDRIYLLESPDELTGSSGRYDRYKELLKMFRVDDGELAVCKFCGYLVSLDRSERVAKILLG